MFLFFKYLSTAFILFFCLSSHANDRTVCAPMEGASVVGSFFDENRKGGGDPDYCEYHMFDKKTFSKESMIINRKDEAVPLKKDSSYKVIYTLFNGEQFAQKILDFSTGLKKPLVDQIDMRKGEIRRASLKQNDNQAWTVFYKETSDSKDKTSTVKTSDIDVNDAGFVYHIRSYWDDLLRGETIKFKFLSIAHGKSIKMSAKRIADDGCENGTATTDDDSFVCIKVSISNVFFRLLAPALWLSFNESNQQLGVFRGIVNLRNQDGENQTGSIYYQYF